MKKTLEILGIIALTAVIVFSMTACSTDVKDRPPPPEKFIKVTGIPSNYNGKIGALKLYPAGSSVVTVYSTAEKISETSVTLPLYNWVEENPWLGSGSFSITIFVFENKKAEAQGQTIYKGVITEINITEPITAIEWPSFTSKP